MSRKPTIRTALLATAALLVPVAGTAFAQSPPAVPQAEVSDTASMPPPSVRWIYVTGGFGQGGVRIFDGDSGKMKGLIEEPSLGNLGFDPQKRFYYVSETLWTKVNRGVRQDMVSIYDTQSLKLLTEIPLPGRLLGGTATQNFAVSADGKLAFVYALQPSSSVHIVDLEKRKMQQTVQLPGCAAIFGAGAAGVAALCSDGSLATVAFAGGKASVSHTAPFFPAATDPIFDTIPVDRANGQAAFLSYTGRVYTATLGASPKVEPSWSIQAAGGLREPVAAPPDVNWLPGGRQPFAVDYSTGRLYVLMHVGEQWSQKEAGEEIWVADMVTHKVVLRHAVPGKVSNIQVSQDPKPLVYVNGQDGKVWILDGDTLETKHDLERAGGGALFVAEP